MAETKMPKSRRSSSKGTSSRGGQTAKYDAHHTVLDKAYGAFADLRRQLADSKNAVAERSDLLNIFATCSDSQRAFLLLEDYFEKLALARKDFPGTTWWPRMLAVTGKERLEETALLFLKNNRPLPPELTQHANLSRFAEIEAAEQEQKFIEQLEQWMLPPRPVHLDAPKAAVARDLHRRTGERRERAASPEDGVCHFSSAALARRSGPFRSWWICGHGQLTNKSFFRRTIGSASSGSRTFTANRKRRAIP
jgi:hypothetical protein